jgi:uncharacterized heparinase superfamily protein
MSFSTLKKHLKNAAYQSAIYDWSLNQASPKRFHFIPDDPWPGQADIGRIIIQGRLSFAGQSKDEWPADHKQADDQSEHGWAIHAHRFGWLRDLRAAGGQNARAAARGWMDDWMAKFSKWNHIAWAPDVIGHRIANWISLFDFYGQSADDRFQAACLDNLSRQVTHLGRLNPLDFRADIAIGLIKAKVLAASCLPGFGDLRRPALDNLNKILDRYLLPDGGSVHRAPSDVLDSLRHLIDIRAVLNKSGHEIPDFVQHSIDKMIPFIKTMRHGNGQLALFHGSHRARKLLVDMAITQSHAGGRPYNHAPHAGYDRVKGGRSLLILDSGGPPPTTADPFGHAGQGAIEFGHGREPILVNCGRPSGKHGAAFRGTAAHSTAILNDANTCEFSRYGKLTRHAQITDYRRHGNQEGEVIELSHNGYGERWNRVHKRMVYLSGDGMDLRGQDYFAPMGDGMEVSGNDIATLRFHLHPGISANQTANGRIWLKTQRGDGWLFQANIPAGLEESVYCADGHTTRASDQVVLTCHADLGAIKWRLVKQD